MRSPWARRERERILAETDVATCTPEDPRPTTVLIPASATIADLLNQSCG